MRNYTTTLNTRNGGRWAGLILGVLAIFHLARAGELSDKKLQAPSLVDIGPAVTFTEEEDPVTLTPKVVINNGGTGIQSATIKIAQGYQPNEDRLTFGNFTNIYGFFDQQKGELVLLAYPVGTNSTVVNFQNALRSVKYQNINTDNPSTAARTISFTITDAEGNSSAPLSKSINVDSKNDAPVLKNLEREVEVIPGSARVNITGQIKVIDADDSEIHGATVKFTNGTYQPIVDKLLLTQDNNNISDKWNALDGILTLSGVDTKENYEKALQNVVYAINGFFILVRSEVKNISITVNDGKNQSESVVRYVAVKDPPNIPSWIADISKNINEDENLTFNENDFRNSYAPDNSKFSNIEIRKLPEHGSLLFDGNTLTSDDIIKNGSGFRIEAANIGKLVYVPDENYFGTDIFEWNSFDGTNFATSSAYVNITVNEVNDAPMVSAPSEVNDVQEDTPATLPEMVVDDIDDQMVQAALDVGHGTLSVNPFLLNNNPLNFTTGDGTGDPVLQFTGTLGYVSYALSALTYQPDDNFSGTDQLTIKITDRLDGGTSATTTATVKITILPSNDAPVLAGIPSSPLAYTENDGPVAIASEITLSDEENNQIRSATVTVQEGYEAEEDKLNFTASGNISGKQEGNQLIFTGAAPLADYQKVIRSITYENTSEKPSTSNRTIGFQVKDEEDATSETVTRTISINSVDDPPVLENLESEKLNFVQFGGPVALTNKVEISDPDDDTVEKAVITFTDNYEKEEDRLTFEDIGKIKSTWDNNSGALTLNGTATLQEYQNALRKVFYDNVSQNPSEKEREVSLQVSSHGSNSNALTRKITIIVNERPTITSFGRETAEDKAISFQYEDFFNDGQYRDPDNFPVEDGFSKIAIRTLPEHGLLVAGEDTLSQSNIDGSSVGFGIDRDAIAHLLYIPAKDYHGTDSFIWNAFDGAQYAVEDAEVNITLTPVNDAPVVMGFEKSTIEDENMAFTLSDFTSHYTDAEEDTLQKIIIRSVPTNGTLVLNGITIPANTEIGYNNINNLTYVPDDNFNGKDSLSWSASDGSLFSEESTLIAISVAPVNDVPVLRGFTKAIAENEVLNFSPEDFTNNYIDVENDPLVYIIIDSLTENGTLLLNEQPVSQGARINVAQLGQLVYQPDASMGGGRDTFSWNASDGTEMAENSAILTIIVGVGVTDFHVFLNEDGSFTFSPDHFVNNYGNPEGDLQEVRIEKLPASGTLELGTSAVTEGQTIGAGNLGDLVYTPQENYFGQDSISWNATDGAGFTNETAEVFFNILPVNDTPEISPVENITIVAGESTGPISFTIRDVETEAAALAVSAFSENKPLLGDAQITLAGSEGDRTITVNTLEGKTGEAVINILVSDGEQQMQQSFTLVIVPYFITLEASQAVEVCNDEPFDITIDEASGGVPPYIYTWTCNQEDCSIIKESGNTLTINPATSTVYYVQATDANGISSNEDTITVNVGDCRNIDLAVPSGFTPNGDGINDAWAIDQVAYLKNVTVTVFNRYGQQVFRSEGYATPWNGTSGAQLLETGTYYYVINVENGSRIFKGSVTILR